MKDSVRIRARAKVNSESGMAGGDLLAFIAIIMLFIWMLFVLVLPPITEALAIKPALHQPLSKAAADYAYLGKSTSVEYQARQAPQYGLNATVESVLAADLASKGAVREVHSVTCGRAVPSFGRPSGQAFNAEPVGPTERLFNNELVTCSAEVTVWQLDTVDLLPLLGVNTPRERTVVSEPVLVTGGEDYAIE